MDKKAVFKELLDKFETEEVRLYCEDMIENIPDYIFTMPSSTSGKFHNATQCLPHGQIYHIIMFGAIMNYRLALKCNKERFDNPVHRDAMRCVPIFHDAVKCGWNGSTFTVHDHPMLAGQWVRETNVEHNIDDEIKEMIARMCERHSGEWTSSKRSKVVLPEPETEMEILVHECDILSSRSDIDMQPSDYLKEVLGEGSSTHNHVDDYVITFGKYKGTKLVDLYNKDRGYCMWLKENSYMKEVVEMIKQIEAKQAQEDDEI
jgi:uncharacterized protein (DUF3820 family)